MGILRGVLFGVFLCGVAFFLFFLVLGGVGAIGVQATRSELERRIDEEMVKAGTGPATREMVNHNVREMNDALISGRGPTPAEIAEANARTLAHQKRVDARRREREAREAGSPGPQAGSAAPMTSARPMVDLGGN